MIRTVTIATGLLLALNVAAAASGPLSITADAVEQTVVSGKAVTVKVKITNTSQQLVTYRDVVGDCDYKITVSMLDGSSVPETAYKKTLNCGGGAHGKVRRFNFNTVNLQPGQSREVRIDVSELYDMAKPGGYSIEVSRTFPGIGEVNANAVNVTVTAPEQQ